MFLGKKLRGGGVFQWACSVGESHRWCYKVRIGVLELLLTLHHSYTIIVSKIVIFWG